MNPEIIKQSVQLWTNEPDKAKVSPVVKARTDGAQAMVLTVKTALATSGA